MTVKSAIQHRMSRRSFIHDYTRPGVYHVTLKAASGDSFGRLEGDPRLPADDASGAHVVLSPLGQMVEHELLHSIHTHYPMVTVDTHVIMPDHLHFIAVVTAPIVNANGHKTHLGQVIAGFKKGCNKRYWAITGNGGGQTATHTPPPTVSGGLPAGSYKVPSNGTSGRPHLFAHGYCDVMPVDDAQLQQQRTYILDNPRSRMLRSAHRDRLTTRRGAVATALTPQALRGYLRRECAPSQASPETLDALEARLLTAPSGLPAVAPTAPAGSTGRVIVCDSYGDRSILDAQRLLPVVCHRSDKSRFAEHKARCLEAARAGAVLVSARIAKGEQEIIDDAVHGGFPVVLIHDNGFPERYHPSAARIDLCDKGLLLLASPWRYEYRRKDDPISVPFCKSLNCVAQALCRQKDSWWKTTAPAPIQKEQENEIKLHTI